MTTLESSPLGILYTAILYACIQLHTIMSDYDPLTPRIELRFILVNVHEMMGDDNEPSFHALPLCNAIKGMLTGTYYPQDHLVILSPFDYRLFPLDPFDYRNGACVKRVPDVLPVLYLRVLRNNISLYC